MLGKHPVVGMVLCAAHARDGSATQVRGGFNGRFEFCDWLTQRTLVVVQDIVLFVSTRFMCRALFWLYVTVHGSSVLFVGKDYND